MNAKVNGEPLLKGVRATGVTDKQIHELGIDITPKHPGKFLKITRISCRYIILTFSNIFI